LPVKKGIDVFVAMICRLQTLSDFPGIVMPDHYDETGQG
jgi:hypothetical protein